MERSLYPYILKSLSEAAGHGWFLDISFMVTVSGTESSVVVTFEKERFQSQFTYSEDDSKDVRQSASWCSDEEPTEENRDKDTNYCKAATAAFAYHLKHTDEDLTFNVMSRTFLDHYLVYFHNGLKPLLKKLHIYFVDSGFQVVGHSQERF